MKSEINNGKCVEEDRKLTLQVQMNRNVPTKPRLNSKNVLKSQQYSTALRNAKLAMIKAGKYTYPLEWGTVCAGGGVTFGNF